jgi:catechol 2,3-dioxygenase-like lactoylglutathione lyase family enzyme
MATGLFPDLRPHHVGISVRDLDEAIAFWSELFGFEVDFRTEIKPIKANLAFLKRDGFRLELFQVEGSRDVPPERLKPNTDLQVQGTKHVCFSVEDVQAAAEALHARGVRIVGIMRGHGTPMAVEADPRLDGVKKPAMALFFLDPSDTLVELIRRSDFKD